jgi:hypothetical protein
VTQDEFDEILRRAETTYAENAPLYWCGFRRGLRRAFLGQAASSQIDHFAWLDFYRDADPCVAELGRGSIDGLEAVVAHGRNGHRPAHPAADAATDRGPLLDSAGE